MVQIKVTDKLGLQSIKEFQLKVVYPWMHPEAVLAAKFTDEGEYWLDDAGDPLASSSMPRASHFQSRK